MSEALENREPSEAELRSMLEARDREKDLERSRTSRKFTRILLGSLAVLVAAIWLFPGKQADVGAPPVVKASPALALPAPNSLNPELAKTDPGLAHDLAPFTIQPGQGGGQTEDIRFAMQLLNFMDAPSLRKTLPLQQVAPVKKP